MNFWCIWWVGRVISPSYSSAILNVLEVWIFNNYFVPSFFQMNMKTGKGWVNVGNVVLADDFFQSAITVSYCWFLTVSSSCGYFHHYIVMWFIFQSLEKLYSKITQRSPTEEHVMVQKNTVERDLLKVLSYQAEAVSIIVTRGLQWGIFYM